MIDFVPTNVKYLFAFFQSKIGFFFLLFSLPLLINVRILFSLCIIIGFICQSVEFYCSGFTSCMIFNGKDIS